MELQCKLAVDAAKEDIWPYYFDAAKWPVWEEDLENLVFDGEIRTGTTGRMKLKNMPELPFVLSEVVENESYCDMTDIPGLGRLFFGHRIIEENGQTFIAHSVRLEKALFTEEDLGFLGGVFADVPGAMMKIKRAAEK